MNRFYLSAISALVLGIILTAFYKANANSVNGLNGRESDRRDAVMQKTVNASTPALLNQSFSNLLGSMSNDQRRDFFEALEMLRHSNKSTSSDTDAEFRKAIDGKSVSAIIAEAEKVASEN